MPEVSQNVRPHLPCPHYLVSGGHAYRFAILVPTGPGLTAETEVIAEVLWSPSGILFDPRSLALQGPWG